jgi:hypothetical protein
MDSKIDETARSRHVKHAIGIFRIPSPLTSSRPDVLCYPMRLGNFNWIRKTRLVITLLAMGLTFRSPALILLTDDFETNPLLAGWTTNGSAACWTTNEAFSGSYSIACSNNVSWLTPLLNTTPLQWYRLSFKSLAPGPVINPGSVGAAYWAAQFFDTNGNLLTEDQYSSIFQSPGWVTNEFRIRAKHTAGPNGTLLPVTMQIRFQSIVSPVYIDDVVVETTSPQEVAQWGDTFYDTLPAKLDYVPKSDRWQRLPLTLNRLRTGQCLRIVMLGDSVEQDTANSPFDTWLERLYPGANIQVISATRGGTGVSYYYTNMQSYVFDYQPDLLCIGGISQDDTLSYFQSVVDQMRANDATNGRTTEILFLTKQWSPNTPEGGTYFLGPGTNELDQVSTNNPGGVPADYRGQLLGFCETNDVEYLDMTGIACEFIYGPAAAAGVGPPTDSNGDPYSFWLRDYVHSSDRGKLIQGRVLEAFFAPAPVLSIRQTAGLTQLAWPLASTGYYVDTAPALTGNAIWASNQTAFAITNGQNVVTTNFSGASNQLFFRLHRP